MAEELERMEKEQTCWGVSPVVLGSSVRCERERSGQTKTHLGKAAFHPTKPRTDEWIMILLSPELQVVCEVVCSEVFSV